MTGTTHGWDIMAPICQRVHNGEFKTRLEAETGVSSTTIVKYYRMWCKEKGYEERHSIYGHKSDPRVAISSIPMPAVPAQTRNFQNEIVLAIPDMHHPFAHKDALAFLCAVRDLKNTTLSLCLGDEIDAASFSRYLPDPDGMTPGQELSKAIESLTPFYQQFPQMLVCESNHTVRPFKKAFEAGLPASFLPTYSTLLKAPDGWQWASKWIIDDVLYIHGDNGKSGAYAHINYMKSAKKSVVIGHIHSYAGVNYEANHFGVNAGCLIDETSYCFKYARNMLVKVNLGCAVIYQGKYAEFIPMRLDDKDRWIGKL